MLERGGLAGHQFGATGSYHHDVFEPNPKFAGNVNAGFVAEGHRCFQLRLIAANQISPLVSLQANAVADSMSEVLIIGSESGISDNLPGSCIHLFAGDT